MKSQLLTLCLLLVLTACGAPNRDGDYAFKFDSDVQLFSPEGLGRGLGCTFTQVYYPTLQIRLSQSELAELMVLMRQSGVQSGDEFWSKLPAQTSEKYSRLLTRAYDSTRINSSLRDQPAEFFRQLFADGMVKCMATEIQSDIIDFARMMGPAWRTEQNGLGVRIYLDPHNFDVDRPIQNFLFCS